MKLLVSATILCTLLGVVNSSAPFWFRLKQCACSNESDSRDDNPVDCYINDDADDFEAVHSCGDKECFCLGLIDSNPSPNDRLVLEPCDPDEDNQKFYYEDFCDLSDHRIFSYADDDLCVRASAKSRGESIRLQGCLDNTSRQLWRYSPGSKHWAAIRILGSPEYCLTYHGQHLDVGDHAKTHTDYCETDDDIGDEPDLLFEQVVFSSSGANGCEGIDGL